MANILYGYNESVSMSKRFNGIHVDFSKIVPFTFNVSLINSLNWQFLTLVIIKEFEIVWKFLWQCQEVLLRTNANVVTNTKAVWLKIVCPTIWVQRHESGTPFLITSKCWSYFTQNHFSGGDKTTCSTALRTTIIHGSKCQVPDNTSYLR